MICSGRLVSIFEFYLRFDSRCELKSTLVLALLFLLDCLCQQRNAFGVDDIHPHFLGIIHFFDEILLLVKFREHGAELRVYMFVFVPFLDDALYFWLLPFLPVLPILLLVIVDLVHDNFLQLTTYPV